MRWAVVGLLLSRASRGKCQVVPLSGAGGRSDVHGSVCQRKGLRVANAAQTHMHLPLFTRSSVQKPRGKFAVEGVWVERG